MANPQNIDEVQELSKCRIDIIGIIQNGQPRFWSFNGKGTLNVNGITLNTDGVPYLWGGWTLEELTLIADAKLALRQLIDEKLPKEDGHPNSYAHGYDDALADVKRALDEVFGEEK